MKIKSRCWWYLCGCFCLFWFTVGSLFCVNPLMEAVISFALVCSSELVNVCRGLKEHKWTSLNNSGVALKMDTFQRFLKDREQEQLVKLLSFLFSIFRHDDLKEMLDSNKDSLKLEAMKRIVAVSKTWIYVHINIYIINDIFCLVFLCK